MLIRLLQLEQIISSWHFVSGVFGTWRLHVYLLSLVTATELWLDNQCAGGGVSWTVTCQHPTSPLHQDAGYLEQKLILMSHSHVRVFCHRSGSFSAQVNPDDRSVGSRRTEQVLWSQASKLKHLETAKRDELFLLHDCRRSQDNMPTRSDILTSRSLFMDTTSTATATQSDTCGPNTPLLEYFHFTTFIWRL